MSRLLVFSGNSSVLSADFEEPIFLDDTKQHVLGFVSFETFNTVPNITDDNNRFHYGDKVIKIPVGSYEVRDLNEFLQKQMHVKEKEFVEIIANNNTLRTHVKCTKAVDFRKTNSVGHLLGFSSKLLAPNALHVSDFPTNILKINSLLIECNIVVSSYKNGKPVHILHQFFPKVPPGFKIVEVVENRIYLPISVKTITNITLKILDQDGELVNFRGETITVGLHLKQLA